jgi:hypothetical protein
MNLPTSHQPLCTTWEEFVSDYYECRPCVLDLTEFGGVPFTEEQVVAALRIAFDREYSRRLHSPKERRIHLNNVSVDEPFIGKHSLPRQAETFTDFIERYFESLEAEDLTLVLHNCHHYQRSIYERARAFLGPLQEKVGLPSGFVGTDIFAGKYRTNSKGLHKDTGAVFMFPLINKKTMAVWPWTHFAGQAPSSRYINASVHEPYEAHLDAAVLLTATPGQAIYFPSHWWHLAYSQELTPTLALNITWYMPTTIRDFLLPVVEKALRSPDLLSRFDHLPYQPARTCADKDLLLPNSARNFLSTLERNFKFYLLQRNSSGGFINENLNDTEILPADITDVKLADARFKIFCVTQNDGAVSLIAEGKVIRIQRSEDAINMINRLNEGEVVHIRDGDFGTHLRPLLQQLIHIGAVKII